MLCRLPAEPRPDRQFRQRPAGARAGEPRVSARDDRIFSADAGYSDAVSGAGIRRVGSVLLFRRPRGRAGRRRPRRAACLPGAVSQPREFRDAGVADRSRRHRYLSPLGARSRRTAEECRDLRPAPRPPGVAPRGPGARATPYSGRRRGAVGRRLDAALLRPQRGRPAIDRQPRRRPGARPGARAAAGAGGAAGLAAPMVERSAALRRRRHRAARSRGHLARSGPGGDRSFPRWCSRKMTEIIRVSRDENPAAEAPREWLVTNGLGGYASATISGEITRRYHGFLIAALPPPLGRMVVLSDFDVEIERDDGTVANLREHGRFVDFTLKMGLPSWRHEIDGMVIEKSVVMPSGHNIVHVTFRLIGDGHQHQVRLRLRPFINFRALEASVGDALLSHYALTARGQRYEIAAGLDLPTLHLAIEGDVGATFTADG